MGQGPRQHHHDHRRARRISRRRPSSSTPTPAERSSRSTPSRRGWTRTSAPTSSACRGRTAAAGSTAAGRSSRSRATRRSATPGRNGTPYVDDNWQYQFTTNATWTRGRHTIKFGGDIVRQALNRFETGAPVRQLHLHRRHRPRVRGGASANQFNNYAAFLLGLPSTVSRSIIPFEDNLTRSRNWQFSTFVKDSWQVSSKLTASLGMRWDYFPMGVRDDARARALRLRHQPDVDLRRRAAMPDRLRLRHGQGQHLAAPRRRLSRHRQAGDPRPASASTTIRIRSRSSATSSATIRRRSTCRSRRRTPSSTRARSPPAFPAITVPDVSSGVIAIPSNVSARALDPAPKRGLRAAR